MGATDIWITDWTANDKFANYGPPLSYDKSPTEPFGYNCLKIGVFVSASQLQRVLSPSRSRPLLDRYRK